jgi:hypothetical protein
MKTVFACLALAGLCGMTYPAPDDGEPPVPAQARGVGYTALTYSAGPFKPSDIDTGLTYAPGYKLYLNNYFGGQSPASAVTVNADGSLTISEPRNIGSIVSIGKSAKAPRYVGQAWGCGAYIEIEASFDASAIKARDSAVPSIWFMSAEHTIGGLPTSFWKGQKPGFEHFIEPDLLEYNRVQNGANHFGSATHDWAGWWGTPCTVCAYGTSYGESESIAPVGVNWKAFHRFGLQWVMATSKTQGRIQYYFDDKPVAAPVIWSQFTDQSPPIKPPFAFGVLDTQHLGLLVGSPTAAPITLRSIHVWQDAHACNLTH